MKQVITSILALLIFSAVSFAGGNPSTNASPTGIAVVQQGDFIKLYYRGETSGKVEVTIVNKHGVKVFSETLKNTDNFLRPYNFEKMEDGEYTVILEDEKGKHKEKVVFQQKKIQPVINLIQVSRKDQKFLLAVGNQGGNQIKVKIFNQDHVLLHEENNTIIGDFAKVYNLSHVPGQYIFMISDENGLSKTVIY